MKVTQRDSDQRCHSLSTTCGRVYYHVTSSIPCFPHVIERIAGDIFSNSNMLAGLRPSAVWCFFVIYLLLHIMSETLMFRTKNACGKGCGKPSG